MISFQVFTGASCLWSEEMKQRNLASVGAVVWRLCGGVRGRAAWRVTSAVPGVVRKADIQFNPPRVPHLVVRSVS